MLIVGTRSRWLASAAGVVAGFAGLVASGAASAESATPAASAAESATVGEIVVTAQKRAQDIHDVPLSITAVGAEAVKGIGHQDVTALVTLVPSLQVQEFSPTTVSFNVRGVSQTDFADSQESPIAFSHD